MNFDVTNGKIFADIMEGVDAVNVELFSRSQLEELYKFLDMMDRDELDRYSLEGIDVYSTWDEFLEDYPDGEDGLDRAIVWKGEFGTYIYQE